jgi:hypothetical protein
MPGDELCESVRIDVRQVTPRIPPTSLHEHEYITLNPHPDRGALARIPYPGALARFGGISKATMRKWEPMVGFFTGRADRAKAPGYGMRAKAPRSGWGSGLQ